MTDNNYNLGASIDCTSETCPHIKNNNINVKLQCEHGICYLVYKYDAPKEIMKEFFEAEPTVCFNRFKLKDGYIIKRVRSTKRTAEPVWGYGVCMKAKGYSLDDSGASFIMDPSPCAQLDWNALSSTCRSFTICRWGSDGNTIKL